jgi:hypothetical protein
MQQPLPRTRAGYSFSEMLFVKSLFITDGHKSSLEEVCLL